MACKFPESTEAPEGTCASAYLKAKIKELASILGDPSLTTTQKLERVKALNLRA